jgi:hypothetical protein
LNDSAESTTPQEQALLEAIFASDSPADPAAMAQQIAASIAPLLGQSDYDGRRLFPRLFDALGSRVAAPFVLDMANFLYRRRGVRPHPATERAASLVALLGSLNERLGLLEEQPAAAGLAPEEIASVVRESVALCVSLCDALALAGANEAIPKLHQTLDLKHRRLRTEAAAALARLGDEAGEAALIELAKEPSARLRVLAYADELDLLAKIPEEFQAPLARTEGELASWLAEPSQFGIAPASLTLVDQRTLFWPGFDDPQECFLFRYAYRLPKADVENIAIAGPLTHAFAPNVTHLAPGDLYALFAGWQAEHDDLRFKLAGALTEGEKRLAQRLARRLDDAAISHVEIGLLGSFFGESVAIARAVHHGAPVLAAIDDSSAVLLPPGPGPAMLGPVEAWWHYVGKKLLDSFNE